jgi:prophage regulatory protein
MRLLGYEDLKAKGINYSRPHLWRLIKAGLFPRPMKFGPGSRNSWVDEEIDDLIKRRLAERDNSVSSLT